MKREILAGWKRIPSQLKPGSYLRNSPLHSGISFIFAHAATPRFRTFWMRLIQHLFFMFEAALEIDRPVVLRGVPDGASGNN